MAIDLTVTLNPSIDGLSLPPFSSGRLQVFQTTEGGGNPGLLNVTTSEVTVSFGSVTPGLVLLYNLDETNFVEVGFATGVYPLRLPPRLASNSKAAPAVFTRQSGSLFLKADTATCKVLVLGYDG
jgi:hypothetical protein